MAQTRKPAELLQELKAIDTSIHARNSGGLQAVLKSAEYFVTNIDFIWLRYHQIFIEGRACGYVYRENDRSYYMKTESWDQDKGQYFNDLILFLPTDSPMIHLTNYGADEKGKQNLLATINQFIEYFNLLKDIPEYITEYCRRLGNNGDGSCFDARLRYAFPYAIEKTSTSNPKAAFGYLIDDAIKKLPLEAQGNYFDCLMIIVQELWGTPYHKDACCPAAGMFSLERLPLIKEYLTKRKGLVPDDSFISALKQIKDIHKDRRKFHNFVQVLLAHQKELFVQGAASGEEKSAEPEESIVKKLGLVPLTPRKPETDVKSSQPSFFTRITTSVVAYVSHHPTNAASSTTSTALETLGAHESISPLHQAQYDSFVRKVFNNIQLLHFTSQADDLVHLLNCASMQTCLDVVLTAHETLLDLERVNLPPHSIHKKLMNLLVQRLNHFKQNDLDRFELFMTINYDAIGKLTDYSKRKYDGISFPSREYRYASNPQSKYADLVTVFPDVLTNTTLQMRLETYSGFTFENTNSYFGQFIRILINKAARDEKTQNGFRLDEKHSPAVKTHLTKQLKLKPTDDFLMHYSIVPGYLFIEFIKFILSHEKLLDEIGLPESLNLNFIKPKTGMYKKGEIDPRNGNELKADTYIHHIPTPAAVPAKPLAQTVYSDMLWCIHWDTDNIKPLVPNIVSLINRAQIKIAFAIFDKIKLSLLDYAQQRNLIRILVKKLFDCFNTDPEIFKDYLGKTFREKTLLEHALFYGLDEERDRLLNNDAANLKPHGIAVLFNAIPVAEIKAESIITVIGHPKVTSETINYADANGRSTFTQAINVRQINFLKALLKREDLQLPHANLLLRSIAGFNDVELLQQFLKHPNLNLSKECLIELYNQQIGIAHANADYRKIELIIGAIHRFTPNEIQTNRLLASTCLLVMAKIAVDPVPAVTINAPAAADEKGPAPQMDAKAQESRNAYNAKKSLIFFMMSANVRPYCELLPSAEDELFSAVKSDFVEAALYFAAKPRLPKAKPLVFAIAESKNPPSSDIMALVEKHKDFDVTSEFQGKKLNPPQVKKVLQSLQNPLAKDKEAKLAKTYPQEYCYYRLKFYIELRKHKPELRAHVAHASLFQTMVEDCIQHSRPLPEEIQPIIDSLKDKDLTQTLSVAKKSFK